MWTIFIHGLEYQECDKNRAELRAHPKFHSEIKLIHNTMLEFSISHILKWYQMLLIPQMFDAICITFDMSSNKGIHFLMS